MNARKKNIFNQVIVFMIFAIYKYLWDVIRINNVGLQLL